MDQNGSSKHDLILRELAKDRTRLANERTLLSYQRTAFMLLVAGGTVIKFFSPAPLAVVGGWTLMAVGLGVSVLGLRRFLAVRTRLK